MKRIICALTLAFVTICSCAFAEDVSISDAPVINAVEFVAPEAETETAVEDLTALGPYFTDAYIPQSDPETDEIFTYDDTYEEVELIDADTNPTGVPYNSKLHTGTFWVDDGYVNGSKTSYMYAITLSYDDQEYLWNLCQEYEIDYNFFLATIYCESLFKPRMKHTNDNGTIDRGICQVNSCWVRKLKNLGFITCADDLYDMHTCMQCGVYIMSLYTDMFGSVEQSYVCYNTGRTDLKSNRNSRRVMRAYEQIAPQIEY